MADTGGGQAGKLPYKLNETNSTGVEPGSGFKVETRVVDVFTLRPHPSNDYSMDSEGIDVLAENIKRVGLIDPPYIREVADGGLQILSGHRRVRAVKRLATEDESWRRIEARVAVGLSDEEALLVLHSGNIFRPVSKEERVRQAQSLRDEVNALRASHPEWKGVDTPAIIANILGMSESAWRRQERIAKGLIPELHQRYTDGKLKQTVALELANQTPEYQRRYSNLLDEKDAVTKEQATTLYREYNADFNDLVKELNRKVGDLNAAVLDLRTFLERRGIREGVDITMLEHARCNLEKVLVLARGQSGNSGF